MIIPNDDLCAAVIAEMLDMSDLTPFEEEFAESNVSRSRFTDRQKEVISEFIKKYDFDCTK